MPGEQDQDQEETRTGTNGRPHHRPRLRFDEDRISRATRAADAVSSGAAPVPRSCWLPREHSGRRFIIVAGLVVLVIFSVLYLLFRDWRAHYRERAAFGANQVVPALGPMSAIVPPGVSSEKWRAAVARTRDLLKAITASNLLGLKEMRALRDELAQTVERARARPERAATELAGVWDAMSERGGFLMFQEETGGQERLARPAVLPSYAATRVAPVFDRFSNLAPPNVSADAWRDAVTRTRARWVAVLEVASPGVLQMMTLRRELERAASRASAHPASAAEELARVWDAVPNLSAAAAAKRGEPSVNERPAALPALPHSVRER